MRARLLKPGFFDDEQLSRLPIEAHFLFAGLWCLADREGRLKDIPRRICSQVFPQRNDIDITLVNQWLDSLMTSGQIERYAVNECRAIQIVNFLKHQNPHPHEAASIIPANDSKQSCNYIGKPLSRQSSDNDGKCNAVPIAVPIAEAEAVAVSVPARMDPDEFQKTTLEIHKSHPAAYRGDLQKIRQLASDILNSSVDPPAELRRAAVNHPRWLAIYEAEGWKHSLKTWWVDGHWMTDPGEPSAPKQSTRYDVMDEVRKLQEAKRMK